MPATVYESSINSLPLLNRGKVRDIYDIDEDHMLIVTTDRLSAFDVILPDPVPEKGSILCSVSSFWFRRTSSLINNHLSDIALEDVVRDENDLAQLSGRSVVVKKLSPLPVEAIVRGYIIGSGWNDYQQSGSICGIELPVGLQQAEKLESAIYTPSTKAAVGDHDENVDFAATVKLLGEEMAEKVREISLRIYTEAAEYARDCGIIIADTKFEFGTDSNGELVLIDEVLTPDSSRFWPADSYRVGTSPLSFDKQYVRDYLETLDWDKKAPGPPLPKEVLENTSAKYREARDRLIKN